MSAYLWFVAGIALVCVGTLAVFAYLHARHNRRQWDRYAIPQQAGGVASELCPHCRQRIYSPRALRERRCPSCGGQL